MTVTNTVNRAEEKKRKASAGDGGRPEGSRRTETAIRI
jgi:hypothetical protein